ncbi:MAG: ATP-binding protein [Alphaproteobacteria bacterium]|nr:ATP-binding protein [Alphaproteobacteria bacterium]MDP6516989.1 ATP-binding protein [Alphaproteobacteria bacterium]
MGAAGPWSRAARLALLVSLPAAAALAALAALDRFGFGEAALAWLACVVGMVVMLRPLASAIEGLRIHIDGLGEDAPEPPPLVSGGLAGDIAAATGKLDRAWRRRGQALDAATAARETILDTLPDPLILLGRDRIVTRANRAAKALLGRDLAGQTLISCLRVPEVLDACDAVLAGTRSADIEFGFSGPDPRHFSGHVQILDAPHFDGGVLVIALHDITEVKRIDNMRADFVANASHEIRTPLTTLVGMIETLRGPARDDAQAREQFLGLMGEHAHRITGLVNDLLSLSRIEMLEHTPPTGTVALGPLLARTREDLAWKADRRRVTIELALDADLPPVIGDESELGQLFQNLLDNAIKYGDEDSSIDVSAAVSDDSGSVAVAVRDHGPGIDSRHLGRLTERFYRIDKARSREMGGTGLGLAIVKHVVNRHRGTLAIESTPGEGSRFTVDLPVAEERSR